MGTKGSEEGGPCKMILGRERAVWEGGRARWRCLNPDLRGAAAQAMSRSGCPPRLGKQRSLGTTGWRKGEASMLLGAFLMVPMRDMLSRERRALGDPKIF